MSWIKILLTFALFVSLIIPPAMSTEGFPKTIVDSANRTVTIDKPVESIVPIITWAYEPILILGLKDDIIGVTTDTIANYGNMTEDIVDKSVGTYREPDYEKIIQLHPDLVIIGRNAAENADEKLASAGIPVVWLNFNNPETFDKEFKILASLTGTEEKANSFLSWKQEKLNSIINRTSKIETRLRVYPTWCDYPLLTASNGSGIQEEIAMAGGINIASGLGKTYPGVDAEWVVNEDPDAIIVGSTGCKSSATGYSVDAFDVAKTLIEATSEADGLNQTTAVKTGKVFVIDGRCEEAARGFIGVYYLAKWLYPDQFKDLNPENLHEEYFEKWLGVPYNGVWAYPQAS